MTHETQDTIRDGQEAAEPFDLFAPDGARIIGTLDSIEGRATVAGWTLGPDGPEPVYTGSTTVIWDAQRTQEALGEPVVLDENGGAWLLRECRTGAPRSLRLSEILDAYERALGWAQELQRWQATALGTCQVPEAETYALASVIKDIRAYARELLA